VGDRAVPDGDAPVLQTGFLIMRPWIKKVIISGGVLLAAIQLVRPARVNPPTDTSRTFRSLNGAQASAIDVIDRSCRDCHTNDTTWPWYSHVAPVSWLLAHDVNEGRAELNFSEWAAYSPDKQRKLLKKSCDEVKEGEMPMSIYTVMHPAAKLSASDIDTMCSLAQIAPVRSDRP
jgi:hypothetical protein